jgi:hypothetical protein
MIRCPCLLLLNTCQVEPESPFLMRDSRKADQSKIAVVLLWLGSSEDESFCAGRVRGGTGTAEQCAARLLGIMLSLEQIGRLLDCEELVYVSRRLLSTVTICRVSRALMDQAQSWLVCHGSMCGVWGLIDLSQNGMRYLTRFDVYMPTLRTLSTLST